MPRCLAKLVLLALLACSCSHAASAGAFLLPEGYGQFIAGIGFSEGSRRFDSGGRAEPAPAYRKVIASGYLEYGLLSRLTLIAAPTLSRENGVAANTVTGSDSSAVGARYALFAAPGRVLSIQVLVQPPLAPGDRAAQLAVGGARNLAIDSRLMLGQAFAVFGRPAFVELAPGARVRLDPFPSEARLDLTLGLRPVPPLLLLLQSFLSIAPSAGPLVPHTSYDKLQASAVYDLSSRWSVQLGAFHTIAGRNAVRETGPFGALWVRF